MRDNQAGFTLAELVIALGIFSLVLVIMVAGVLQLFNIYEAGHQIRDTQEAARLIAGQITNDTHDSLAVAVGTVNGQSAICLYKTLQRNSSSETVRGVEYYIAAHDTSAGSYPTVHQTTISATFTPPALPGCADPGAPGPLDQVLTTSAVTVKKFSATDSPASNPRLVSVAMSVESSYAQQPGDVAFDPATGLDQCNAASGMQYCSITNLEFSALNHSEKSL